MTRATSLILIAGAFVLGVMLVKDPGSHLPNALSAELNETVRPIDLSQSDDDPTQVRPAAAVSATSFEDEHAILFPDGDAISIRLRRRPAKATIPNESSLLLDLEEAHKILTDAFAARETNAAFRIWELKQFCRDVLGDKESLDKALSNIYEQEMYSGPWGLTLSGEGSGQRIVDMVDTAQRHFEQCRDIQSRDSEKDVDWLRRAAEMGDSEALKKLGPGLAKTKAAVHAFEQAWQHGEIYANAWLSNLYANGIADDNGQIVQDATQAYAHQYLFAVLLEAKYAEGGGREHPFAKRAWDSVTRMETGLHPHELNEAYEIAKTLLHEDCCLR